jgi:hypothetical protein
MGFHAFMFGYWGWGSFPELLLDATAAVEDSRGFGPPCFVDIRVSRSVRATGFREKAFEKLAGANRYVWMPELGNKRVAEHRQGLEIVNPKGAETLLDLVVERAKKKQRLIFFCACPWPGTTHKPLCHRRVVGDLLLKAARPRGVHLEVDEWPGGTPTDVDVKVSANELAKIRGPGMSLTPDLSQAAAAGLPWGSLVTARCRDEMYSFVSGPAQVSRGKLVLRKLVWGDDDLAKEWKKAAKGLGIGASPV